MPGCGVGFLPEGPLAEYFTVAIEQAIDIGKKEVPGKVIEAEIEDGIYEVKIRTESGERVKFKIDPKDGTIIRKGRIVKGSSKGFSKQK